ncbi:MAG TPA: ferrous iron transporter B [Thermoanaerobaculia bacterium]|nr:ferrous iron transporter B [Thermoanaerobaculia bacterium]
MPDEAARAAPPVAPAPRRPRVALLGNPNTGKTTLFNRLCGVRAKTANFPGTTTDVRFGRCQLGSEADPYAVELIDLPGLYRLSLELPESRMVAGILAGGVPFQRPEAVVVVVDATNLVRNLFLVGEVLRAGLPTVVALNMIDLAQRRGLTIDARRLSDLLGCPVVPIVARRGVGVDPLRGFLRRVLEEGHGPRPLAEPPVADAAGELPTSRLEEWSEKVVAASVGGAGALGTASDTVVERLDQAFTHPVAGILIFTAVMSGLFWTIFAFATVPMDLIEATFAHLGAWVEATLPPGAVRELVAGGVLGGIAGTVVFLPQICLLFFLISLLEDTGYLARAAFVMDRVLCRFGLPGYAFVPLLAAHACALPGILSTKLIPDRQDRLTTILVAPFMSCSARLPVYVLLTTLLFHGQPFKAGLAFAGCYLLGAVAALGSAAIARRTILPGRSRPMVLELPSYKLPSLRSALFVAAEQGISFLKTAGTVILAICIVMWWLSAYPKVEPPAEAGTLRAAAAAATDPERAAGLAAEADAVEARHQQGQSFAGRMGRAVEPVFAPLGYDWQLTVGVLTSFLAREVFVSTLTVLLAGTDAGDTPDAGVIERIRAAERSDGTPLLTPAASASLLVFFVLAMQCLPTLATSRKESGSWKWPALQLVWMSTLAWIGAFATYHGLGLLGIS